jgi:hypothetical protein
MRAGPLSNDQVISLLNSSFVPVYAVNEDYGKFGSAPAEEKAELSRVYHASLGAGLSTGTVHVYILTPDGKPIDSLHVAEAAKTERLLSLLAKTIDTLKVPAGKPLVPPAPQSAAPPAKDGALVLHLTARGEGHGSWREFPAENWIVLTPEKAARLLPAGNTAAGARWEIEREAANGLLTYFYPQTENNDVSSNRIEKAALRGEVMSIDGGVVRARLSGELRMQHSFYPHRPDDKVVEATMLGYLCYEADSKRIRALELVTESGTYAREKFAAALRLGK